MYLSQETLKVKISPSPQIKPWELIAVLLLQEGNNVPLQCYCNTAIVIEFNMDYLVLHIHGLI